MKRTISYLDKNQGVLDDEWDDSTMSEKAKVIMKQFRDVKIKYICVTSISVAVLIEVSKYYNTEFGVTKKGSGDLAVIKGQPATPGNAGRFRLADGPNGYTVIFHIHPAWASYRWHFTIDVGAATSVEATADWNANIVVYDGEGVKNKKDGDRLIGLETDDPNWPISFMNSNKILS